MVLQPQGHARHSDKLLDSSFQSFGDWTILHDNKLSPIVVDELQLDDFLFRTYQSGPHAVSLYIGYYSVGKKVGAAHDPQVCYPGQGWKLSDKRKHQIVIQQGHGLKYSSIVADLEGERDLIYYWFQIDTDSAAGTLMQKLFLFRNKLMGRGEANAFVRISTTIKSDEGSEESEVLRDFVNDFYPQFENFMVN
jgi:EpsI family protein